MAPGSHGYTEMRILDVQLNLIHIPLQCYMRYVGPILQILMPPENTTKDIPFFNISFNPVEVSVICPQNLTDKIFRPLLATLPKHDLESQMTISIAPDTYMLMFVIGSSEQASQRLVDLTSPLAFAGTPIFYITTYFSDYILCPYRSRSQVITDLVSRGLQRKHTSGTPDQIYVASYSQYMRTGYRRDEDQDADEDFRKYTPGTPIPTSLKGLQFKTFSTLKKWSIKPNADKDTSLLLCGYRSNVLGDPDTLSDSFLLVIVRYILSKPKYMSFTIVKGEKPSILLEKSAVDLFTSSNLADGHQTSQSMLLGDNKRLTVPILLDLKSLPLEISGILCGIAAQVVDITSRHLEGLVDMTFMSTTRAGLIVVDKDDLDRVMETLDQAAHEQEKYQQHQEHQVIQHDPRQEDTHGEPFDNFEL